MEPRKQAIIAALRTFISQRPGLEFGNYGDVRAYRSELRGITKDLHDARELMRAVELSDSITADDLLKAAQRAYMGRLSLYLDTRRKALVPGDTWDSSHGIGCHYVTGQYWPTEYRKAVCSVLASALWEYTREKCMPPVSGYQVCPWDRSKRVHPGLLFDTRTEADSWLKDKLGGSDWGHVTEQYAGQSAGDWLRAHFRQQFGRGIASRWFS
jgi:hypothetical protein